MKTKFQPHAECVEILNKPGRWLVIKQYTAGGFLLTSDNDGSGFSEDEALKLCVSFNILKNQTSA